MVSCVCHVCLSSSALILGVSCIICNSVVDSRNVMCSGGILVYLALIHFLAEDFSRTDLNQVCVCAFVFVCLCLRVCVCV